MIWSVDTISRGLVPVAEVAGRLRKDLRGNIELHLASWQKLVKEGARVAFLDMAASDADHLVAGMAEDRWALGVGKITEPADAAGIVEIDGEDVPACLMICPVSPDLTPPATPDALRRELGSSRHFIYSMAKPVIAYRPRPPVAGGLGRSEPFGSDGASLR